MKSDGKAHLASHQHPNANPETSASAFASRPPFITGASKRATSASVLLSLALAPILASCSTATPKETHPQPGATTAIQNLLVVASSKDIKVTSDVNLNMSLLGIMVGPAGVALDWSLVSMADAQRAAILQPQAPKQTIAERLSAHFTKSLSAAAVFASIEQAPLDKTPTSPVALSRFDAIVRLELAELRLRPVAQNQFSLFLAVRAEMVSLKNGTPAARLWSREEKLVSQDPHPLEFYRNQGIPALDQMLVRLAKRLADDVAYTK